MSPNEIFNELVTTTWRKHRKEVADAVSNNNALLKKLNSSGMKETVDGGLSIVQPLEYAENSTYQRYSGYDILNIGASDVLSAAEFPWRQIAIHVTANGQELRTNSGESRLINLVKSRMKNAIHTFKNNFSYDIYSDGTLPNQITGLQALISDNGLGTVGGIDANAWAFWRNKVQSAAAPMQGGAAITPSGTPGVMESLMMPLYMALTRGSDRPDLIITSNEMFGFYETGLLSFKRYTSSETAKGGFMSLKYKDCDIVYDGGSGIPANHMYFLNTNTIRLVVHKDADMPEMRPINQDATVTPIIWMGNLTVSNRMLNGVLKA